ncbi:MAG: hypothetical protein ABJB47_11725 [Actinomycetota bacterium]
MNGIQIRGVTKRYRSGKQDTLALQELDLDIAPGEFIAVVGPSGWEVAVIAALEIGIASAITAGLANWLWMRRSTAQRSAAPAELLAAPVSLEPAPDEGGHTIYLDPWAGDDDDGAGRDGAAASHGPSALP